MAMAAITLRLTCFAAPVQYEGNVDGNHVYFRARWDTWALAVATGDAVAAALGNEPALYRRHAVFGPAGDMYASWMPHRVARRIIERCLAEYLSGQRGAFSGKPARLAPGEAPTIHWVEENLETS